MVWSKRAIRPGQWSITAARPLGLLALGALALPVYVAIRDNAARIGANDALFLWPGLAVTVVAVAGCALALGARPSSAAVGRLELGLIVAAGLAFRLVFLGTPPALSHDAYRYVWDAHLVAHGVSPYTHPASDPALAPLRDGAIWPQVNWPDAPTIYPPGAQALYLLVHALAPLNITAMQLAMGVCDVLAGALTIILLRQHGLDPRRSIVYWWNPIPILEFSFTGHVDAAATLWTAAALVAATGRWRGARTAAGAFLGLAALTKLYPLLFVVALARRHDWGFLLGMAGACALVVPPFARLGLGAGGFLGTYFAQRFVDQGLLFRLLAEIFVNARAQAFSVAVALLALCALARAHRLRGGLRPEAGILALSAGWILLSPHLFPWYVGGLLPPLALYLRLPGRIPGAARTADLAGGRPPLAAALWLFALAMPFTYVIFAPGGAPALFSLFFVAPLALAILPLVPWREIARRTPLLRLASAPRRIAAEPAALDYPD